MKYLVVIFVIAAGTGGFFIGAHKGKSAIDALAALEQAAKQEKSESDKAISALKESVAGLAAEHRNQLSRIEAEFRQQRAKLEGALAGKEEKIKDMTANMNMNHEEIARLRGTAGNATDPAERQKLLERIAQLESEKRLLASSVEGLKCLGASVPDEILGQLQKQSP